MLKQLPRFKLFREELINGIFIILNKSGLKDGNCNISVLIKMENVLFHR